jgi:alkanesulfonate monooxygenase SsuD/methylene tetrahydromethanopterin reductase-like flavin-dependent oxidoreductase (luciferase family)
VALLVDYGLVSAQRAGARTWQEEYDDAVALAVAAEDAGFDGYWVTEHHFTDDGYLSALFPLLGALAQATSRMTLGTNVALAPLYHPLRLAEDAAVVDLLSHGRLLLGLAIGYRDEEFAALVVPKRERVARLRECVEICRKAWTGEPFSHRGPTVTVDDLVVRPVPAGPPPIWLGGWVDDAVRRAAVLGDGYISPVGDLDDTRRRVELLDAGGRQSLPIATATWVVVTRGDVPTWAAAGVEHLYANYESWYSSSSDDGGGSAVGSMIGAMRAATSSGLPPGVAAGTPEQVLEILEPLATAFSADRDHRLCVRLQYPGMTRAEVLDHIALFATEVLPRLRRATSLDEGA